jgi:hypothetical protein
MDTRSLTVSFRAYIAASRRSDRSLEARIESARRASEIHKKRTGRALRVTEDDVVNEEMYEEEDDDALTQHRRLQTYLALNTGSIFDGRLNSWMLGAMGTRAMVMNGGFGPMQHQPTPFFPYTPPHSAAPAQTQLHQTSPTQTQMFSPMSQQGQQQGMQSQPGTPVVASANQSGQGQQYNNNVSSPLQHQGRSTGQDAQQMANGQQKVAQPVSPHLLQTQSPTPSTQSGVNSVHHSPVQGNFYGNSTQSQTYGMGQAYSYPNQFASFDPMSQFYGSANMNLLSPSLPVEAQQMFGLSAFDPSNPSTQQYMNQSHGMPVPASGLSYHYNPNLSSSNKPRQTSMGMSQTLSQSPLHAGHNNSSNTTADMKTSRVSSPYARTPVSSSDNDYMYNFDTNDGQLFGEGAQNGEEYSEFFDADGGGANAVN